MSSTTKFILASSSEERLKLLQACGYIPDLVKPADIDESEFDNEMPRAVSMRLAIGKAKKISESFPYDIVLAADTVVGIGRTSLPKAMSIEDASLCMEKLSGRRHRVYTGLCVSHMGISRVRLATSIVKFKRLSSEEKQMYIESREWYGKAGGYALRGLASIFIEYISGLDTTVMGLPMNDTYTLLNSFGLRPKIKTSSKG